VPGTSDSAFDAEIATKLFQVPEHLIPLQKMQTVCTEFYNAELVQEDATTLGSAKQNACSHGEKSIAKVT